MKIYLAGPLFTLAERNFNKLLAGALMANRRHKVFLPQEMEPHEIGLLDCEIFRRDVRGIDQADVVVANVDGADPDAGTAWEVGYAYGIGKPIVLFRTDFRKGGDGSEPYNLMLSQSARVIVKLNIFGPLGNTQELARKISSAVAVATSLRRRKKV